jgi:hypothetical protein
MSDSIFKRVAKALARMEKHVAREEKRASSSFNLMPKRPDRPFERFSRHVFVYHPQQGPSQTLTRFTLREKSVDICRQRFGESRQVVTEDFPDHERAEAAMQRLVDELKDAGNTTSETERDAFRALIVRNPELEAALQKDASDATLQVYADYLLERGDLRGELIQMMITGVDTRGWLRIKERVLLGPLYRTRHVYEHRWRRGFIERLLFREVDFELASQTVEDLFQLPATLLLEEVVAPQEYAVHLDRLVLPPSLKDVRLIRSDHRSSRPAVESLSRKVHVRMSAAP